MPIFYGERQVHFGTSQRIERALMLSVAGICSGSCQCNCKTQLLARQGTGHDITVFTYKNSIVYKKIKLNSMLELCAMA
ncbi:MAG: hypothetical protein PHN64_07470 [Desulfovibrionaceae bacterium]|nr:hypothetical protein [Desulfovibrionaceae bacterium]